MNLDCACVEAEEIVESYVLGRLGPEEQEAFEEHYFECAACFDELQTWQALRTELGQAQPPKADSQGADWRRALPLAAGLIFAVVTSGLLWWQRAPTPESVPSASESRIDITEIAPPAYSQATLRGVGSEASRRFASAMEIYLDGDYQGAIEGLEAARNHDPELLAARFFLGASYLLVDRGDVAMAELEGVVAQGDSPYLEEASLLLAKAYLRSGDGVAAKTELERVVALEGALENDAATLLSEMEHQERR